MIKSMTGYSRGSGTSGTIKISIELKSVNNRYLDCSIKIPRIYIAAEEKLKALVQKYVERGKVDVFVTIDASEAASVTIKVNHPAAEAYLNALAETSEKYEIPNKINALDLMRFPDIIMVEKGEADTEALFADLAITLEAALKDFNKMRILEGERLVDDINRRLDEIERLTALIEEQSPKSVEEYRNKLLTKMTDVLQNTNIDESRILLEAAIFADKVAVNEEIVRLKSHVKQLRTLLLSKEPVGRKIDFLVQELNREGNTIGSKGNDISITGFVIDLKSEIEKIREQAQNIE